MQAGTRNCVDRIRDSWLGNLRTPMFALIVFAACVWALPIQHPGPSIAGTWIADRLGYARIRIRPAQSEMLEFVRRDQALVPIGWSSESDGSVIPDCSAWLITSTRPDTAWWAPTVERFRETVDVFGSPAPTSAERDAVRATFLIEARKRWPTLAAEFDALAAGDIQQPRVLWLGVLHNTLTLASFFVALASIPLSACRMVRQRRAAKNLCPSCSYSRRGLQADAICPECGTLIER